MVTKTVVSKPFVTNPVAKTHLLPYCGIMTNIEKLSQLDNLFESEIKANTLGSAAIHVERHGKVLFDKCYGEYNDNTIYKIYSMSKPITAVAVMILYERGLISLQEPASKWLPALKEAKVSTPAGLVPSKNQVTLQHLLNMTSGVVYPGGNNVPEITMQKLREDMVRRVENGEKLNTQTICDILASCPLQFEPGTAWRYGASADLLGAVIERVTGQKLSDFLKKEIFEPLEMTDTFFAVPRDQVNRLAKFYSRSPEGKMQELSPEEIDFLGLVTRIHEPAIESGGGGLYSTMHDYVNFCRMLIGNGTFAGKNGEVKIISPKTINFMTQNALKESVKTDLFFDGLAGYGYANLMRVMTDLAAAGSNGSIGEYGWDGLPGTYFMIDPKEDLFAVYMQQIAQGADVSLRRKYRQIIYGAIEK